MFHNQSINDIYEYALNNGEINDKNPPTFCCCFHKHKTSCEFVNNLKNELYNDNQQKNIQYLIKYFSKIVY